MRDKKEEFCTWETKPTKEEKSIYETECGHQSSYKYQHCPFCKKGIYDPNEVKAKSEDVVIMSDVEHIKIGGK